MMIGNLGVGMTSTHSRHRARLERPIAAALLCMLPLAAQAGTPDGQRERPLYFWGAQRSDGSSDAAAASAIRQRLLQAGALILPLPSQLAGLSCIGAQCPEKLAGAESLAGLPVVGAYLDAPPGEGGNQGESAHLWWLDTATSKLYRSRLSCQGQGCSLTDRLAREAVFLAEREHEQGPAAVSAAAAECASARPSEATSEPGAAPPSPAPGLLSSGIALSLTTSHGTKVPTRSLLAELQSGLQQLGVRTTVTSASSATASSGGARLLIELQGSSEEKKPGSAIQTVFLALSAPNVSRQMRLYCPAESCGRDLARFLRVNVSALLDGAEPEPPLIAAPCPPPAPTGSKVASLNPGPLIAAPVEKGSAPSASEAATRSIKREGRARSLCIAGAAFTTAGLAGLIPSVVMRALDRSPTGRMDCAFDGKPVGCVWDTAAGATAGIALSSTSLIAGAIMIGVSYRRTEKKGSPCYQ